MSFQILNKEGQAIGINTLDAEAAKFWGKEVHVKQYATPREGRISGNWFDVIGLPISCHRGADDVTWKNVIAWQLDYYIDIVVKDDKVQSTEDIAKETPEWLNFYKPYIELVLHWKTLGYTPKTV